MNNINDTNLLAASPSYPGRPLVTGSQGTEVSIMQSYLNAIRQQMFPSMNRLTVDGIFGNNTRAAVVHYQSSSGLYADGIIGPDTWNSIVTDYNSLPVPPADQYPGSPLRPGDSGNAVLTMQSKLNLISPVYTAINRQTADGRYGTNMTNAVKRFQGQFGLETDGIIGPKTWDKITSVHSGITVNNNTAVESRYPGYVLNTGSRGDSVRFIQSYLNAVSRYTDAGWSELTVDGIYGQMTKQVVRAFQTKFNLKTDGIVGRDTWAAIIRQFNNSL